MKRLRQLNRREFLGVVGHGTVALVAQLSVARNVLAIALGGSGLAACTISGGGIGLDESPTAGAPLSPSSTPLSPTGTAAPTSTTVATATLIPYPTEAEMLTYLPIAAGVANAYVLVRGEEVAIVDTGVAGNGSKFAAALETVGLKWDAVKHVILTHYHGDHVGSMGEVMAAAAQAVAYAGADDIPLIESPRAITAVADQSEVFGLQIIASPGHTKGHICVYDPIGSALITGDALNNSGGRLSGPNPSFTQDMALAIESARKLAALSYERAYFGHGTPIEGGASAAIAALFPP